MRDPLIEALARGFPSWEERNQLARATQLEDVQLTGEPYAVWESLLEEALAQGRTHALANAIEGQGRPRLAQAVRDGGLADNRPRWAVLGAFLMGCALFLFLFYVTLDPGQREVDARMGSTAREVLADLDTKPPRPVPAKDAAEEPATPSEDPTLEAQAEPSAEAEPEPEPAPSVDGGADIASTGWGACTARPGERIGYAYAGQTKPSGTWHTAAGVNVREDYPRPANRWSLDSPTVCVLPADVDIPLVREAIQVQGEVYYVPIIAPKEAL